MLNVNMIIHHEAQSCSHSKYSYQRLVKLIEHVKNNQEAYESIGRH